MNKDIALAVIKSPLCLGILSFMFACYVMHSVVVPIVHVVTTTIPSKMDAQSQQIGTVISKLDDLSDTNRLAFEPKEVPDGR